MEILTPFTKNPNKPTLFNWTPIQLAILGGHVEAFKVLDPYVDKPNAPSPGGWTPLQIAARDGHTEVVETLIRTRYPNAPAPDKWTPLQHAARNGKYILLLKSNFPLIWHWEMNSSYFPPKFEFSNYFLFLIVFAIKMLLDKPYELINLLEFKCDHFST